MALSTHETNVVQFFQQNVDRFIAFMFEKQTQQYVLIDDVFSFIIAFLDLSIKRELRLYTPGSDGYDRHIDMLIETNIMLKNSEAISRIVAVINRTYRD